MASIQMPTWWDEWVIQGLWKTTLKDGAPKNVVKEFNKFIRTLDNT